MRQKLFSMRLDPETKALLEEAAASEGLSMSAFIRSSAVKESKRILREERNFIRLRNAGLYQDKLPEGSPVETVTSSK